jgi:hypothetical protein
MSGDIDAQAAQLLDEAPDFGAAGGNFLSDFGAADHDGRVLHEEADDATETDVGGLGRGSARTEWLTCANCGGLADAEIMRDSGGNNNLGRWFGKFSTTEGSEDP